MTRGKAKKGGGNEVEKLKKEYVKMKEEYEAMVKKTKSMKAKLEEQYELMRQTELYLTDKGPQELGESGEKTKTEKEGGSQVKSKTRKDDSGHKLDDKGQLIVKEWVTKGDGRVAPVFEMAEEEEPTEAIMEIVEEVADQERRNPPIFLKEVEKLGQVKEALLKINIEADFKTIKEGILIITRGSENYRKAVATIGNCESRYREIRRGYASQSTYPRGKCHASTVIRVEETRRDRDIGVGAQVGRA